MSFGFQFDDSEMDEEYLASSSHDQPFSSSDAAAASSATPATEQAPFVAHTLSEMLPHLPSRISYSSINVALPTQGEPSSGPRVHRLLRRDLFDARFQMLLDEEDDYESEEPNTTTKVPAGQANVDADSDLIPGVYEGGLKTWECALDLVETLDLLHANSGGGEGDGSWSARLRGKNVLELGCGTALPSLFILSQILKDPVSSEKCNLTLHLADYNAQVLQLVTLPNLILAWYTSPAASDFRSGKGAEHLALERHELARRGQDHFDTSTASSTPLLLLEDEGELAISDELLSAFSSSLTERGVELKFYAGGWANFPPSLTAAHDEGAAKIDMILTSETIYSLDTLPELVSLLSKYAAAKDALVLVAAKVIYFGVGGGVESFKQALAQLTPNATVESLHSVTKGVGRTVLSVTF